MTKSSAQEQALQSTKDKIKQTIANRPTRDQAIRAIYIAYDCMRQAMDMLGDIFTRENEFHLYQDIHNRQNQGKKTYKQNLGWGARIPHDDQAE